MMDWTLLARQVIALGAPVLGAALGGPLGSAAGRILAEGVGAAAATPEAINDVLPTSDKAAIAEAEMRWVETIRAEAETARAAINETNATIRAEMASDDLVQRWWRPLYAVELTLECAGLWIVLLHEFWTNDLQTINALIGATALLVAYWGFRFGVLGVYVSGRTREKLTAATGETAPTVLESLAKRVAGRRSP